MTHGIEWPNFYVIREIEIVGADCYHITTNTRIIELDLNTEHIEQAHTTAIKMPTEANITSGIVIWVLIDLVQYDTHKKI